MTRLLQLAVVFTTLSISAVQATEISSFTGCLEGNCFNGYGSYKFGNGNRYVGEFTDGKPHGNGILYCANGNKYLGSWEDSFRQGEGRYIFVEGHEYLGQFHRNNFHGKGTMQYANGDRYEGNWEENYPNGHGTYFFKKGSRYEGNFLDGSFHGQGTMYYINGARYSGHWRQSKKHGSGTYYDVAGQAVAGEWNNGNPLHNVVEPEDEEVLKVSQPEEQAPAGSSERSGYVAETGSIRIWAVVVGVADYKHMPSLRYTDDDAYQFYAFLKSPAGGALPDKQVRVLVDDNATHGNILGSMRDVLLNADENDVILFYFSGHGIQGAFIPADFDGYNNRLYHEEIRQIMDSSRARYKLVLGDACHSGSYFGANGGIDMMASRSTVDKMLKKYYKAFEDSEGGMALLMSSKGREVSLEDTGLRSGVFSHFLIKGLKGAADYNQDDIVTIQEIFEFTFQQVSDYTVGAQTPVITGSYDGKMPVSVVRNE